MLTTRHSELVSEKISGLSKIRMELTRFIEMFGAPVQNPMGWRKKLLSETAVIITGNTPSRADKNNYGTYLEWIKTDNITSNTFIPKSLIQEYFG